MIPSTTNRLLVSEDWKKIYQTFRNADFKSYDFETLRRTMITYLRENYPEDFNDYIESSEYIALVDLIAYLGQNLSFRIDLNARENFIETAERRDSILRLARLINYNAKRNIPANGFLKILSISTNDNVLDANGINLSNQIVTWNDPTNANWYQQFISVLNSTMPGSFVFGRPYDKDIINGIEHQQYRISSSNTDVPLYSFNSNINGTSMSFEVVSSLFSGKTFVYEDAPLPANQFSYIYKNDNQGNGSSNTGFFMHFRQGATAVANFTIDNPVPNETIGINAPNINNSDVWLWQLDGAGNFVKLWTKVEELAGNNVIYNSISKNDRSIYTVVTRENDQIDLSFSDGSFGDLPKGEFALYYRQSNGLSYVVKPDQLSNISLSIAYKNKNGQDAVLNVTASLQSTVNNSVSAESNGEIKTKAPQTYYVQNRMVTAEDYNIAPLSAGNDILKIKSVNRISSGVSKFFELSDVSGQYSKTNIFADDGILYKKFTERSFEFSFITNSEILGVIRNTLAPVVAGNEMRSFYYDTYPRVLATETTFSWTQAQKTTNQSKGYFKTLEGPVAVGSFSGNSLRYVTPGALIKFIPPIGKYFLPNNNLTSIQDATTKNYIWVKAVSIVGDGFNNGFGLLEDGTGPVILTENVPTGAVVQEIIPKFINKISPGIEAEIVNICSAKRNLGLSFDAETRVWYIVSDTNLDLTNAFSLLYQKDVSNIAKDNSWFVAFEWTGRNYKVRYRILEYFFESEKETAFFVDKTKKNYDFVNDTVIKDQVRILSVNQSVAQTSVVTSTPIALPDFITTATSTSTVAGSAILRFNSTTPIESFKYYAIHPNIISGKALVIDTSTTAIQLASTLTSAISTGSLITFVPRTVIATTTTIFSAADVNQTFSIAKDFQWQVDSAVVEPDGYVNPNKINVSFFDSDEDGQIDDPDAFTKIVQPDTTTQLTGFRDKFVYFKKSADGQRYALTKDYILAYPTEDLVSSPVDNQLYYFYDPDVDVIKRYSSAETEFTLEPDYFAFYGRTTLKFHYLHNSGNDRRLDPSKTNLIDVYLLTKTYDLEYRNWLSTRIGEEPDAPTSQALEESFSSALEPIKSISDEVIFQPTRYKILFGDLAPTPLQGTFKAVRNTTRFISDNDIKTRIITAIEEFFSIENWNFGQSFHFSELSTYVMNKLSPDITNFVLVPKSEGSFGSLFEITCLGNEIFINGATVNDIEVISALTSSELKATSNIVTSSSGI